MKKYFSLILLMAIYSTANINCADTGYDSEGDEEDIHALQQMQLSDAIQASESLFVQAKGKTIILKNDSDFHILIQFKIKDKAEDIIEQVVRAHSESELYVDIDALESLQYSTYGKIYRFTSPTWKPIENFPPTNLESDKIYIIQFNQTETTGELIEHGGQAIASLEITQYAKQKATEMAEKSPAFLRKMLNVIATGAASLTETSTVFVSQIFSSFTAEVKTQDDYVMRYPLNNLDSAFAGFSVDKSKKSTRPYTYLGIPRHANLATLELAYRYLTDKWQSISLETQDEEHFVRQTLAKLDAAYRILRAEYDRLAEIAQQEKGGGAAASATDSQDAML